MVLIQGNVRTENREIQVRFASHDIITQDECINQLIKLYQIPEFLTRLTAKPVENGEQWETPVDNMVQSEKRRAAPQAARKGAVI
jgi:hypothetical protein